MMDDSRSCLVRNAPRCRNDLIASLETRMDVAGCKMSMVEKSP